MLLQLLLLVQQHSDGPLHITCQLAHHGSLLNSLLQQLTSKPLPLLQHQ
jgi:hypothetical protein